MYVGIVIVFFIGVFATWLFLMAKPEMGEPKAVKAFNWCVITVAILLCAALNFKIYSIFSMSDSMSYFPFASTAGTFMLFLLILVVGFLLRNFWIFRTPRF